MQPDQKALFDFTQGQYLTFRREFEGEELQRYYSICAGKYDGVLQVGIKRVDGRAFSTWANAALKVGDELEATLPMGNFYRPEPDPRYTLRMFCRRLGHHTDLIYPENGPCRQSLGALYACIGKPKNQYHHVS